MVNSYKLTVWGCAALGVSFLCTAAPPDVAVRNCARTEAARLDARLSGISDEIGIPDCSVGKSLWVVELMELCKSLKRAASYGARPKGASRSRTLCTVDKDGKVIAMLSGTAESLVLGLSR